MTDVLVLCYHAVSSTWSSDLAVRPEDLERQLQPLVRRGYRGATFTDAVARPPGPRALAVTFDDAYRSVLELAAPVLERLGLPGSIYTPTAFTGSDEPMSWPGIDQWADGPHRDELLTLGWSELGELRARGWEVGSHTVSHPRLTDLDDERLDHELRRSKAACEERLGAPCRSIAYPYGAVDGRVEAAARAAGYEFGAALPDRFAAPRPLAWPRVGVYGGDTQWRMRLKSSRWTRRLRTSSVGHRTIQLVQR